jgi:hypothetical protein
MSINVTTPAGNEISVFFDTEAEAFMVFHANSEISFGFTIEECAEAFDRDAES